MFDVLLNCKPNDLLFQTEQIIDHINNKEEAEKVIRMLWNRVPELTVEQEKKLHQLGRKIRKKFHMKPIVIQ